MGIDIDVNDIQRTHWIGTKTEKKRRPIIVKFTRYSKRRKIFNSKKRLIGKNLSITERSTKLRISKPRTARDEYGFRNVWTVDGKILYKVDDTPDSKSAVYYQYRVYNRSLSFAEKKWFRQRGFVFVQFLFLYVVVFRRI